MAATGRGLDGVADGAGGEVCISSVSLAGVKRGSTHGGSFRSWQKPHCERDFGYLDSIQTNYDYSYLAHNEPRLRNDKLSNTLLR